MTPALNKPLPEFEALATGGVKFTPQAYAGQTVVLYFYPKDNTPGCTTEAMQFRDHHKEFVKAGAVVFGVSRDNMASHDKFKQNLELPFELIADTEEKLCHMFGVVKNKIMYGKKVKGIERSTFLIDGSRHVARRMAWPEGRRPCGGSSQDCPVAEEGCLSSHSGWRIMAHARENPTRTPSQAARATVRLFYFPASLTPPCHCPSRQSNEPPSFPPSTSTSQATPKPGKRSTRARAERVTYEPDELLDARLVAGATPTTQRTAASVSTPSRLAVTCGPGDSGTNPRGDGTRHKLARSGRAATHPQAAWHRSGQAVRARHQRADARPDEPVPLRGARHLPADDHARGARRPQEGHDRGGAQRAPGQPRPRRAGRQHEQPRQRRA